MQKSNSQVTDQQLDELADLIIDLALQSRKPGSNLDLSQLYKKHERPHSH